MGDVRRTIRESKAKIRAARDKQAIRQGPSKKVARNTPAGRRLAALRKSREP